MPRLSRRPRGSSGDCAHGCWSVVDRDVGRPIRRLPARPAKIAPAAAGLASAQSGARGPVKSLEVVVLSTMLADRAGVGEWGFSALVEADGHRILFDTGARPETVLQNARELKIDLSGVTDVILSHHHGDHAGGLVTLRRELAKQNPDALKRAYVGAGSS